MRFGADDQLILLKRAHRTKFAIPVRSRNSTVPEEVARGDERAICALETCADRAHFVWRTSPPTGDRSIIRRVSYQGAIFVAMQRER
jgi:hypothetical protein